MARTSRGGKRGRFARRRRRRTKRRRVKQNGALAGLFVLGEYFTKWRVK